MSTMSTENEGQLGYGADASQHAEQPRDELGRFGTTHQEPETVALSNDPPELQGTYFFPPIIKTADQSIEFFSKVEIPDSVLVRIDTAQRDRNVRWTEQLVSQAVADATPAIEAQAWQSWPKKKDQQARDEYIAAQQAECRAWNLENHETVKKMALLADRASLRNYARAGAMLLNLPSDEAEADKVLDHELEVNGKTRSLRDIHAWFKPEAIPEAFTDYTDESAQLRAELLELRRSLDAQTRRIEYGLDEVRRTTLAVGEVETGRTISVYHDGGWHTGDIK